MKRFVIAMAAVAAWITAMADRYVYNFEHVPASHILVAISRDHPHLDISFIYDELEDYDVTCSVDADDAVVAIRRIMAGHPVSVLVDDGRIVVEAMQHGRFHYFGRVVDEHGNAVEFASVMLLSPGDSTVVTYGSTRADGRFSVPCDLRYVIAKFSGVGYKMVYHHCRDFNVGNVVMTTLPVSLDRVTVEARHSFFASDRISYVPTARQKNAAQNAIDLLRILGLTQVSIDPVGNSVTTNIGENVAVYIDYMPATDEDLDGLRTADVRRVEYLDYPTDPRFRNKPHVINIIMARYEFGGYTKLSIDENIFAGLSAKELVYSKFAYKNMTYDVFLGASNVGNRHTGSSVVGRYNIKDDSGRYRWLTREEQFGSAKYRTENYPVTFRTDYSTRDVQLINTLSFSFNDVPVDMRQGAIVYIPSSQTDARFDYEHCNRVSRRNWSWTGDYSFVFSHGLSMNVTPELRYSRNHDDTRYISSIADDIRLINSASESAYEYRLDVSMKKQISQNHSLSVYGIGGSTVNQIDYVGDKDYSLRFSLPFAGCFATYNFKASGLNLSVQPGLMWERTHIDNQKSDLVYPVFSVNLGYSSKPTSRYGVSMLYANSTPNSVVRGSNIVQQNELLYHGGNPKLDSNRFLQIVANYSWSPHNWFSVTAFGSFFERFNSFVPSYSHYNDGYAIIKSYINSGHFLHAQAGLSFNIKLFDQSLNFQAKPSISLYRNTGYYDISHVPFKFGATLTYYFRQFYFQCHYQLGNRSVSDNSRGGIYNRGRDFYQFGVGWSNSRCNLRLTAINVLSDDWVCSISHLESPVYAEQRTVYGNSYHRRLQLSLSYTIGYGKKLKRGNEIGEQSGTNSAILK